MHPVGLLGPLYELIVISWTVIKTIISLPETGKHLPRTGILHVKREGEKKRLMFYRLIIIELGFMEL